MYSQDDRLVDDIFGSSANFVRQEVDRILDLAEVGELLVGDFFELCPRLNVLCAMVQSELKWTSRDDTITSWQEVETNDRLENGGFTCGLCTQHHYSWQPDILLETDISQFVNDIDEFPELLIHEAALFLCRILFLHVFS